MTVWMSLSPSVLLLSHLLERAADVTERRK